MTECQTPEIASRAMDTNARMDLVPNVDVQADARLRGLMAVLQLPALRRRDGTFAMPVIEIRISHARVSGIGIELESWVPIERFSLTADRVVFSYGTNGHTKHYDYPISACPPWRMP